MIPATTLFLLLSACLFFSFVPVNADDDDAYPDLSLRIRGQSAKRPLKVFLLAGQSNMVGMGSMKHLDLLVQDPDADPEFRDTLWNGTSYRESDDVWIRYTTFKHDQHGKLRPGNGFGGKNSFGPELMFGWTVGDALVDEPVLLIKTAWGGKDLAIDFRPPASGQGSFGKVKPIKYGWRECPIGSVSLPKYLLSLDGKTSRRCLCHFCSNSVSANDYGHPRYFGKYFGLRSGVQGRARLRADWFCLVSGME